MIAESVASLKATISSNDVTIITVTKTQSPERIRQAVNAGLSVLGENRVQEAAEKVDALRDLPVEWHLIGHLQTNKVKQAVALFSLIQSVDSLKLALEINRQAAAANKIQDILLQITLRPRSTNYEFQITNCKLRITNYFLAEACAATAAAAAATASGSPR